MVSTMTELTAEVARERLSYEPESGVLTWIEGRRRGHVAGCHDNYGYIVVRLLGKNYKAHRLIWLIVHGEWPAAEVDHANNVRDDNRLANLRLVTSSGNGQNQALMSGRGTSRFLGVCWSTKARKWQAQIKINRKVIFLGHYAEEVDAANAYMEAKARLHPFSIPPHPETHSHP